jgi:8-oxo-dGTP diphosphatase
MSPDGELYERDPAGWSADLAGETPGKPASAAAPTRSSATHPGRVLLVDPTCKPDWDLPSRMPEATEPPAEALRRELCEELGLEIGVGELLCVVWVCAHGPWDDLLRPDVLRRAAAALQALATGRASYLQDGHPATTPWPSWREACREDR